MTFDEIEKMYNKQWERQMREQTAFYSSPAIVAYRAAQRDARRDPGAPDPGPHPTYPGFQVDYATIHSELREIFETAGFSPKQSNFIVGHADQEKHAQYHEVITYARELFELLTAVEAISPWREDVQYLLDNEPTAVRVREGGGPEDLLKSLAVTFVRMQEQIRQLKEHV